MNQDADHFPVRPTYRQKAAGSMLRISPAGFIANNRLELEGNRPGTQNLLSSTTMREKQELTQLLRQKVGKSSPAGLDYDCFLDR